MEKQSVSGTFTGKTVQEAIEEGLKELGISAEEADIQIVEEPKKGFLGFGESKAKVIITKLEVEEKKSDAERTIEFLKGLFEILALDVTISDVKEEEKIIIQLETEDTPHLIGKKGEVLDSIQTLAGAVANIGREEYKRVVLDCENYRQRREDKLVRNAKRLADKAVAQGRKIKLEPMNPYERRIIHSALVERGDVKTQSEGKEPNRFVVIIPNELKPYNPRNKGKKPYDKDRKPYKKDDRRDDRKYRERKMKEYAESSSNGEGTGTGTGFKSGYGKSYKKSSSSFFGTYLGNSRTMENSSETSSSANSSESEE